MKVGGRMRNQKGFTLIEIIAVLVILGVLASVAVPKYFDLQTNAKKRTAEGAVAEGAGRVNTYFGRMVLSGTSWDTILYTNVNIGTSAGDFALSYTSNPTVDVTVRATGKAGTAVAGVTKTKQVRFPGKP